MTKTFLSTIEVVALSKRLDEVCKPIPGTDFYAYTQPHSDATLAAEITVTHPGVNDKMVRNLRLRLRRPIHPSSPAKNSDDLEARVDELERVLTALCTEIGWTPPKAP